jgi:ribose 5-phosphate isomerase A
VSSSTADRESWKRAAAAAAAELVADDMIVGLGTGSTAAHLVDILGERVRNGLKIAAVPTSERTHAQAVAAGIRIIGFADATRLDLTIDGADEIARRTLDLIKGGGGALLREKIVASASDRMVVISDASKLADRLGGGFPLPVEIVPFGWQATISRLDRLARATRLRRNVDGSTYLTDGGHYIVDCDLAPIDDAAALERELAAIVGVVESGLFVGMADLVIIADADGVHRLTRG